MFKLLKRIYAKLRAVIDSVVAPVLTLIEFVQLLAL